MGEPERGHRPWRGPRPFLTDQGTGRATDGSRSGTLGACATVLIVPLGDLPDWLPAWCLDHLGGEPVGVLFRLQQVSMVFGLRLAGGTDVVVKARADDGRAVSCVAAQARRCAPPR